MAVSPLLTLDISSVGNVPQQFCIMAGVAYLQLMAQRSANSQAIVIDTGSSGFNMARLLRSGIYVPISEALGTFYQVGLSWDV